jgi:hypothetical protein
VSWNARDGKWQGQLKVGGGRQQVHVGYYRYFDSEHEAAAAVVARQRELGLDPDRRQASEFRGVGWRKNYRKWCAQIKIGGKMRHLGYFQAGHPGEVDAALAFDAAVRALGSAGRATKASERTNFEVPGQGARGLSREQAADVEARLEQHLRAALLAAGRANSFGEEFERQLPQQVMPAPACPRCPPAEHGAGARTAWHAETGRGAAGLVGAGRAVGAGRRRRAGRRGSLSRGA